MLLRVELRDCKIQNDVHLNDYACAQMDWVYDAGMMREIRQIPYVDNDFTGSFAAYFEVDKSKFEVIGEIVNARQFPEAE